MITERGQSLALMITIIARVHDDQQITGPCCGLQRRVQHALCESNRARPGQQPDGPGAPVAQAERDGVGGVVQSASRVDYRLLLVTSDVSLRATVQDQRDRTTRHARKVCHILCSCLAYHFAAPSRICCNYSALGERAQNCMRQPPFLRAASKGVRSKTNRL